MNASITSAPSWVEPYLHDLGPDDADITSHDTYVNGVPHATFARLRRDDPVSWWDEADGSGFWAVTRYHDALAVSRNHEVFTSTRGIRLEEMDDDEMALRRTMMEIDPPEHSRLRRLVSRGFTRRVVWTYEHGIRQIARDVLDTAIARGEFDFVHDVAQQLPMRMLGRLLGTPDDDGDQLVEWGDALLGNTDPDFTDHVVDLDDTDEFRLLPFRSPAAREIFRYAEAQATTRRACPGEDVISQLLAPTVDGEPLSDLEFKNFFALLVAAGNDTTRYSITHGVWTMLENPSLWEHWRAHPESTDSAVEEILRTSAVTMHFRRTATRDVELGGRTIRAGDKVVMWFNSANHDETAFPDPFRFDLARHPNQHMSFGWNGPHLCLGAWLARMELKVLFEELFARVDHIEANGPREHLRSNFIAGIKRLPVKVSAGGRARGTTSEDGR